MQKSRAQVPCRVRITKRDEAGCTLAAAAPFILSLGGKHEGWDFLSSELAVTDGASLRNLENASAVVSSGSRDEEDSMAESALGISQFLS